MPLSSVAPTQYRGIGGTDDPEDTLHPGVIVNEFGDGEEHQWIQTHGEMPSPEYLRGCWQAT